MSKYHRNKPSVEVTRTYLVEHYAASGVWDYRVALRAARAMARGGRGKVVRVFKRSGKVMVSLTLSHARHKRVVAEAEKREHITVKQRQDGSYKGRRTYRSQQKRNPGSLHYGITCSACGVCYQTTAYKPAADAFQGKNCPSCAYLKKRRMASASSSEWFGDCMARLLYPGTSLLRETSLYTKAKPRGLVRSRRARPR